MTMTSTSTSTIVNNLKAGPVDYRENQVLDIIFFLLPFIPIPSLSTSLLVYISLPETTHFKGLHRIWPKLPVYVHLVTPWNLNFCSPRLSSLVVPYLGSAKDTPTQYLTERNKTCTCVHMCLYL